MIKKGLKLFGISLLSLCLVAVFFSGTLAAGEYPTRSITFIVPWGAGGGTDLVSRQLAAIMSDILGVSVNVENHTGAGGAIGINQIAGALADGYTIGMGAQPICALQPFEDIPISPEIIQPIALVNADETSIIVSKDAPWEDLNEFIEEAKQFPGKLNAGLTATGAFWQAAQIFFKETDISVNEVTYTAGAADIVRATMAGEVDFGVVSAAEASRLVEDGELRYLVLFAKKGSMAAEEMFPDAPLISDYNYDIVHGTWRGIIAPRGIPEDILRKLEATIKAAVETDRYIKFMTDNRFGIEYVGMDEFTQLMQEETESLIKLAEELGY